MSNRVLYHYIDNLRFPLMLAVLFVHSYKLIPSTLDSLPIIIRLLFWIMSVLSSCCVPLFFFISGFLFFSHTEEFDLDCYFKKIKRRFLTLLIPYILWNILDAVFIICCDLPSVYDQPGTKSWIMSFFTWRIFWFSDRTWPLLVPFWFVRDLIVLCVLSPLLYLGVKKLKILFLGVLYALWFTAYNFPFHLGIIFGEAGFYFSLGAYFSIHKIDLEQLLHKGKVVFLVIYWVLLPFVWAGHVSMQFFMLPEVFVFLLLSSIVYNRCQCRVPALLTQSSLFVLAIHAFGINKWIQDIFRSIIPDDQSSILLFLRYILCPIVVAALCVFLFWLISRCAPRIASILVGQRNNPQKEVLITQ